MAYAYCRHCDIGLDAPTMRESLTREYLCPGCEHDNEPLLPRMDEALGELLDRLEALEETVARLDF